MQWPNHYQSLCPPSDATSYEGTYYRFTNRATPKLKDFLSYYDLAVIKNGNSGVDGIPDQYKTCQAKGLSVYRDLSDCIAAREKLPSMRKKKLAAIDVKPGDGLSKKTPSRNSANHYTFWVPSNVSLLSRAVDCTSELTANESKS